MISSFEILVLVETLALFSATALLAVFFRKASSVSSLLDEVISVSEYGAMIFDRNGNFLKSNRVADRCLSLMTDEDIRSFTRSRFLDCLFDFAADIDESIKNTILEELDKNNEPEFREVVSCKGGELFLIDARNIQGGMTLFIITDIKKGRKREENIIQLNTFNHQLMQAIQATTSGIIVSDPKINSNPILFVNDAFCEFSDCKRRDLMGADWSIIVNMLPDESSKEKFVKALASASDVDLVLETNAKDKRRYFSMKFNPVKDDSGELDLFIGILSEITLLKQRELEFFHVQKLESLGQLAAGVAHDFNNILSIIGGYSVMASNTLSDEHQEVKDYLKRIDAASERGASLTSKMLTFSKHKVITQSVINVCDVVNEQKELLIPLLGVSVSLKVKMPDTEVNMQGRADSLGQILMNFVINGRDAMPEGGMLFLDVTCLSSDDAPKNVNKEIGVDDYIRVSVSDTGTGMDESTIEKIFDPFFSTKDQGKGTGLGLSVVYGLVNEMGGVLDVESVVGEGTTMSFYVPLTHKKQSKKILGDAADLNTICLDGYTVLVAEDEPDLLLLVSNMLAGLGLNVLGASDGDEALVMLDDNIDDIDILLTDIVMPGMNGVKLAELASSLCPELKIIFMSGYPASGDMAPVELPQDVPFVAKPVDYNSLAALILQKLREGNAISTAAAIEAMPHWETTKVESNIGRAD